MSAKQRWYMVGGVGIGVVVLLLIAVVVSTFTGRNSPMDARYQTTSNFEKSPPSSIPMAATPMATSPALQQGQVSFGQGDSGLVDQVTVPRIDPSQPVQNRIVLKNATMSITVGDPASTIGSIGKMAEDLGGWVVSSSSYQQANASGIKLTYGNITIRVPADKLNMVLGQINSAAVSVDSVNITGDDVTEQYTDLSSQLTNLQTAETDLRRIMDSATKTQDVLSVYQQLTNIRGQVEVIQGKLKYFDQSAAYSSIAVTLSPRQDDKPLDIAGWQPGTTLKSAIESLVHIFQGLVDFLIWLAVTVLPFAVLLYIVYLLVRRFRRRTARSLATVEAHEE